MRQLDAVQKVCPSSATGDLIKQAVLQTLRDDPVLFEALASQVSVDSLYSVERTDMGVVLAAEIGLVTNHLAIGEMLVSGAAGVFGGTAEQIDMSALCVLRLLEDGDAVGRMVESILSSNELPASVGDRDMGGSLMHILSLDVAIEGRTEIQIVDLITSLLDHPVLGNDAARYFLRYQSDFSGPRYLLKQSTFENVLQHAQVIVSM